MVKIRVKFPEPHSDKQALIMQFMRMPEIEELWVAAGTKFGKTLSAATAISSSLVASDDQIFRWIAPYYNQTKIGIDYCKKLLPPYPYTKVNKAANTITMDQHESYIQFFHAQNPEALEGYAISGYVFDEAAKIKEGAYAAAKTTRTVTRGPMGFFSTPLGKKSWFYKGCMEAKEHMFWSLKNGKTPKRIFITARTEDNPHVPRESIAEARRSMSPRIFSQYFEAEFVDDGGIFIGVRQCIWTMPENQNPAGHERWLAEGHEKMRVVLGVDWAKTVDSTVFIAIDIDSRRIVGYQRFTRHKYTEAVLLLCRFVKQFKECLSVYHDKTGVGQALDDQLSLTDLPYEGITFTNSSKSEMVNRLSTGFETKDLLIPQWDVLLSELDNFEVKVSPIGTMQYAGANGQHDDTVCALMLAYSALLHYGDRDLTVKYTDEKVDNYKYSPIEKYYRDILGDDDD